MVNKTVTCSRNGPQKKASSTSSKLSKILKPGSKDQNKDSDIDHGTIKFNVLDLGGQELFQNTHRFFMTNYAIYVVMFDLSDESTYERAQYHPLKASTATKPQQAAARATVARATAARATATQL